MSSIPLLPLLKVTAGVQTDEDFALSLAFFLSDGVTPINLSGLTFTASIGTLFVASSTQGTLVVSGASSNILSFNVTAAAKATWPAGVFALGLLATDGTSTRDVFANSTLAVGAPALDSVAVLVAPGGLTTAAASAVSSAVAAVATLQSCQSVSTVSASAKITAPGVYIVTTAGVSLTLASPPTQPGAITIKDMTGSSAPNIKLISTIDGSSAGLVVGAPYEAVSMSWSSSLETWVVY